MRLQYLLMPAIIVFTCGVVGCGSSEPRGEIVETVPASGIVTLGGKPLENCQVNFYPVDGGRPASATTNANGEFTLGTNDSEDGAAAGLHKVAFIYNPPEYAGEPGKEEVIPGFAPEIQFAATYADPETSGVTQEIPAEGTSEIKIDLR